MFVDLQQKITAPHLARNAYVYVRQSTVRQVFENTESTKRQYDLARRPCRSDRLPIAYCHRQRSRTIWCASH